MAKRLNISISDKAYEVLKTLAPDCGMSASQCLDQMVLRNHAQFRALFALDSTQSHTSAQECTHLHGFSHTSAQSDTQLHGSASKDVIEPQVTPNPPTIEQGESLPDFLSLIANS